MNSIVVTGLGVASPLGVGVEDVWQALLEGKESRSDSPKSQFKAPIPQKAHTLEASEFDASDHADPRFVRRLSRISSACLVAALGAVDGEREGDYENACVMLGTAFGSGVYHFEFYEDLFERGLSDASPLLFSESVVNAATGHICHYLGVQGPGLAFVAGEDSGVQAVIHGLDQLRGTDCTFALVGGADEYVDLLHASLSQREIVGEGPGTPFSEDGNLCAYGEGAGFLRLERLNEAAQAERTIYCKLLGGLNLRSRPDEKLDSAVARVVTQCLNDLSISPQDIDLVVSGARGGKQDIEELNGLIEAGIGTSDQPVYLCAPKVNLGEAFGFSSCFQAIVAAKSLEEGKVPPGLDSTPSDLPGQFVLPTEVVETDLKFALVISTTPTGGISVLVMGEA